MDWSDFLSQVFVSLWGLNSRENKDSCIGQKVASWIIDHAPRIRLVFCVYLRRISTRESGGVVGPVLSVSPSRVVAERKTKTGYLVILFVPRPFHNTGGKTTCVTRVNDPVPVAVCCIRTPINSQRNKASWHHILIILGRAKYPNCYPKLIPKHHSICFTLILFERIHI